jgi:cytosine deaminase
MTTRKDMEVLYDMVTTEPAKAIGLEDYTLKVGAPANLVVLHEPNVLEALRNHDAPAYVISHGKLVDQEKVEELASS